VAGVGVEEVDEVDGVVAGTIHALRVDVDVDEDVEDEAGWNA